MNQPFSKRAKLARALARRTALSMTLFAAVAALAVPAGAEAANAHTRAKSAQAPAKKGGAARKTAHATPAAKAATRRVVARSARVHGTVHASRPTAIRTHRVAYAPSRSPSAQAFGMNESGGLALRSSIAYVVDQNTNAPLFDKNSQAVVPIASISKLMTAIVTLDAKMPLDDMMIVTDEDRDYEKGTGSRLSVGSRLSRADMLHIALMSSENRAAAALSRYYPGGRPAFIAAMNQKARELGMTDTHFENSTGLSSQNVSSARDLVKLVEAAYQYPLIRQYSTDTNYDVYTGRAHLHYGSTNALVRKGEWEIGLQKTGFINEAGECLVMQATINARPVVIVLLDSVGKYSRIGDAVRVRQWLMANANLQRVTSASTGHPGI